jgi:hypothetical protein
MKVPAPEEFKKVCRNLVQGLDLVVSSREQLVQLAMLGIEPREHPAIKAFIDELLSGRYSDDELRDIWWSMPSDLVFYDGRSVVAFLTLLRNELDKPS